VELAGVEPLLSVVELMRIVVLILSKGNRIVHWGKELLRKK
jgi:hypothetical protein